jgi:hypothetical protein
VDQSVSATGFDEPPASILKELRDLSVWVRAEARFLLRVAHFRFGPGRICHGGNIFTGGMFGWQCFSGQSSES